MGGAAYATLRPPHDTYTIVRRRRSSRSLIVSPMPACTTDEAMCKANKPWECNIQLIADFQMFMHTIGDVLGLLPYRPLPPCHACLT